MGNLIVCILVLTAAGLAIRSMIRAKQKGKSISCGGDCSHCAGHCSGASGKSEKNG